MPTYYDTIIDPSGERLSSEAAEVISEMNRQRSPLLRLPAEIRNKIYGYALGGMELRISYRTRKFALLSALSYDPSVSLTPLHRRVGLTLVSRQLYAETKTLPFELCTMDIIRSSFPNQIERLNTTQRQAISIIRAHYMNARDGKVWAILWPEVRVLTGLKRVEVYCCPNLGLSGRIHLVEAVEKGLGRDDVDIVVDS
ncbi:uncharacterized protein J4E78_004815 [Alternaria triticimaculans]|uniref:uncharacterized protein n=1 Tax=Alternaria triticimaculans TaxID=297637 RepID=UPI0020C2B4F8|nr:uncharacterized protein J4E78_004815 [Alternaria triticimaculans]KAI4662024.1 hypothetical protein J4E78_004815 [Alternaria triticimaculans]